MCRRHTKYGLWSRVRGIGTLSLPGIVGWKSRCYLAPPFQEEVVSVSTAPSSNVVITVSIRNLETR